MNQKREMTRREFVKDATIAAVSAGAAITIVPRHVLGLGMIPPSDLLNIAAVGVGGMGRVNLINLASQNIVALCDVDWGYAGKGFAQLDNAIAGLSTRIAAPDPEQQPGKTLVPFDREQAKARLAGMQRLKDLHLPKAKRYTDYREMLEKQKDIEGVLIATPDHMHAPIALAAMNWASTFTAKPLTWCVAEARNWRNAHGNPGCYADGKPGTFADDARKRWSMPADAIGEVREIHIWTNRPLGFATGSAASGEASQPVDEMKWNGPGMEAAAMAGNYPVPEN
jgi:hypothetical protein